MSYPVVTLRQTYLSACVLSFLAVLGGYGCYLVGERVVAPLRVLLAHDVMTVDVVDERNLRAGMGMSGIDIEDLRARLGAAANVTPVRVEQGELRVGRTKEDLRPLVALMSGLAPLEDGRCVDPSGTTRGLKALPVRPCFVEPVIWSRPLLDLLSGGAAVRWITQIDLREAYLHPENVVYRAVVIPKDESEATRRYVTETIARYEPLRRTVEGGAVRYRVHARSWREQFREGQKTVLGLILALTLSIALGAFFAVVNLGLIEAVKRRGWEWIRWMLGEPWQRRWWRWAREAIAPVMAAASLLLVGMSLSTASWSGMPSVAFLLWLAAGLWLGRVMGQAVRRVKTMLAVVLLVEMTSFAVCAGVWWLEREAYEQKRAGVLATRWGRLTTLRVELDGVRLPVERWKAEMTRAYRQIGGAEQEPAYVYPLPTEVAPMVAYRAAGAGGAATPPVQVFRLSRRGVARLGLHCDAIDTIPEERLEKGMLISRPVAKAVFGEGNPVGAKLRDAWREYAVIGICEDPEWGVAPPVFLFEPTNWAYLLLDEGMRPLGQVEQIAETAMRVFLPLRDRVEVLEGLLWLAVVATTAALVWFVLLEARRREGAVALRLAVGGAVVSVSWELVRRYVWIVVLANLIGFALVAAAWQAVAVLLVVEVMIVLGGAVVGTWRVAAAERLIEVLGRNVANENQ